jgi:5'-3' exonuclease
MGVPGFYRWLVERFPKLAVKSAIPKQDEQDNQLPNVNGIEFDNLYLDMNGIIHICSHPGRVTVFRAIYSF